ncbi:JmjC domain-containing protein [Aquihabitans daechungensis]|uniref:JmjC domain-containing protein n=1 Tax=Aquihabitans daechungensis TaxID=1052257 RepID=UPI003BA3E0C7
MDAPCGSPGAPHPDRTALADGDLRTTWRSNREPLFARPWSWYGAEELIRASEGVLERCVADVVAFRSRQGQIPFVAPTRPEGFTDLIDLDAVEHLLATGPLPGLVLHLLRHGPALPPEALASTSGAAPGSCGGLDAGRITAELTHGATLVLTDAQDRWPPLRRWCELLGIALGEGVTADVRLAPAASPSAVDHVALSDALVLQVAGTARWTVEGWALDPNQPDDRNWVDLTGDERVLEVDLGPGQCLAVPRGFTYASVAGPEPSLDLVVWADGRAGGSRAAAEPGERWWSRDPWLHLAALAPVLVSGSIAADTPVSRREGSVVWSRVVDGRLVLRTVDREVSVPARVAGWVDRLLGGPAAPLRDLVAAAELPDALTLVRRLVREGVLEPQEPQGGEAVERPAPPPCTGQQDSWM